MSQEVMSDDEKRREDNQVLNKKKNKVWTADKPADMSTFSATFPPYLIIWPAASFCNLTVGLQAGQWSRRNSRVLQRVDPTGFDEFGGYSALGLSLCWVLMSEC